MDPRYRNAFNAAFTDEIYRRYERDLSTRLNSSFEFRLAETPVFLPAKLRGQLVTAATEILEQLSRPENIEKMKAAIPDRWRAPNMDALPSLTQIDFAVVRDSDGELAPRLIELQGFPSLTAMQVVQRDAWVDVLRTLPGLDQDWSCWFSGLTREAFLDLTRATIVGTHDPAEVVLLDIDPPTQKTAPDFVATKLLFGVDAIDPRELRKRGARLHRNVDGREIPVRRIYNRVVFDELERKQIPVPFSYQDELDVEWCPHPNWYWVWSKYSIPFLNHPTVPKATFVSDLRELPADLSRYVLKPLFSFAGGGVNVDPTRQDVERIPGDQRPFWCLQEKIEYAPAIRAVDGGGVKAEIRMMFLRPDSARKPMLAQNLARLSRGKMLGVDFNKGMTWVGSSVAVFPAD
jgi:hypothetical protein